jgi:hypothetical protein
MTNMSVLNYEYVWREPSKALANKWGVHPNNLSQLSERNKIQRHKRDC